jgi:hypothetical protein
MGWIGGGNIKCESEYLAAWDVKSWIEENK